MGWGLATTNAITIKTLEAVTWRPVDPVAILNHLDEIKTLCDSVRFADKNRIMLADNMSQVFTKFYPMFEKIDHSVEDVYVAKLGPIRDGNEWLAFTFQEQPIRIDRGRLREMLDFSAAQLEDAYSRMDMGAQAWTKHTAGEVDFIENAIALRKDDRVLDMGCGQGRHTIELSKRGYDVIGVDFSDRLLDVARRNASEAGVAAKFLNRDCRALTVCGTFSKILCVYDVIGSFRTIDENRKIIASIYKKLRRGGMAIVSVMNMELTKALAKHKADIMVTPESLLSLKSCNIMQMTGNVFNPDYYLLDEKSHLVYRKEQFEFDGELSSEHVIADYRFTADEIIGEFESVGFTVKKCSYVQAGRWDVSLSATDTRAKEILIIAEKL